MLSTPATSSVPATLTQPSRPSQDLEGKQRKEKKMLSVEEIFPMYKTCKDSNYQGGFHDFVEMMKLYDKNNDNSMIKNELYKLLTTLGEKMSKQEANDLMKELCEPEDEDGFMPFLRKYSTQ